MESGGLHIIPYITLWVHRYDETLAFYRDILQLDLRTADNNFAQFATGGTALYLHRLPEGAPLRDHTVEIHFEVADVDEAYRLLSERGARFVQAPADMPWGVRMAALRDPEGYGIEIIGPVAG